MQVFAVGDRFIAVALPWTDAATPNPGDARSRPPASGGGWWERDATADASAARWRPVVVPTGLAGGQITSMASVAGRVVVEALVPEDPAEPAGPQHRVLLSGSTIDELSFDPVSGALGHPALGPPAPVDPGWLEVPTGGRGIRVRGDVESVAAGPTGVIAVGSITAGLNLDLLPPAVVAASRAQPGRIDIAGGRVLVRPGLVTVFDASLRDLGATDEEIAYLERPEEDRRVRAVWVGAPGGELRLVPPSELSGLDGFVGPRGETAPWAGLEAVSDGYVLASYAGPQSVRRFWSADGLAWTELAPRPPPDAWPATVELDGRWVRVQAEGRATVSVVSDDHGRSWRPVSLTSGRVLGFGGAAGLGVFAFGHPVDAGGAPTYPGTLFFAPDGERWTQRTLPELVGLDSLSITVAAGPAAAVLVTRRAVADPPAETELFLVTPSPDPPIR